MCYLCNGESFVSKLRKIIKIIFKKPEYRDQSCQTDFEVLTPPRYSFIVKTEGET
jgi:hypothetical protein